MIKRNRYSLEYKEKLVRELSLGKVSLTEVSKREKVSYQTLQKWTVQFGYGGRFSRKIQRRSPSLSSRRIIASRICQSIGL